LKPDSEPLRVIVKYCEDIEYFIALYGSDEEDFNENMSLQYGCAFSLIQIGEQIKQLSSELRGENPEVDWRSAAGLRDIIAHRYGDIDIMRVRSTILNKIPLLKDKCICILSRI